MNKAIGFYEGVHRIFYILGTASGGPHGSVVIGDGTYEPEVLQWRVTEAGKSVTALRDTDGEGIYEDEITWGEVNVPCKQL